MKGSFRTRGPRSRGQRSEDLLDVFNIGAASKVESYEIASYESLVGAARDLKLRKAVQLLSQNLKEEQQTLKKMQAFSNHLFQLTRLGFVNCYLVRENDGFTLIDTGMSGQAQPIIEAAQKLGLPIVRIVLTHAHVDHVGSLDALHEALLDTQVAISERDARFLTGDQSLDLTEPQVPLRGGYPVCKTKPTLLLHAAERQTGSLQPAAYGPTGRSARSEASHQASWHASLSARLLL